VKRGRPTKAMEKALEEYALGRHTLSEIADTYQVDVVELFHRVRPQWEKQIKERWLTLA
jgi:hypothetical protein